MTQSLPPKSLVFYADDDVDDIDLVKEAFREYQNVELLTFRDGKALLDHIGNPLHHNLSACLIILDINMPRLNGKETLRKLRNLKDYNETPIVLFSTSTLPGEASFAKTWNASFITKPLHADQINKLADILIDHCTDEVKKRIRQGKNG